MAAAGKNQVVLATPLTSAPSI